jgi:hypothetical protein
VDVITEFPEHTILLMIGCLALGAVYAFVLYYREHLLAEVSVFIRWGMGILRVASVALIAFFLLGPLLKNETREVEKPVIVLAQDNSESLVIGKDSSFYRGEYLEKINALTDALSEKYDVHTYTYGDGVRNGLDVDFTDKRTDISDLFSEIYTRMSNRNLGAIVMATDGIFNTGSNPVYSSKQLKVPVFTIALGDTAVKRDLLIGDVAHNRLAYLGNDFPLEILVEAKKLEGRSSVLRVSNRSGILHTQTLTFDSDNYFEFFSVQLEAKKTGLQRIRIEVLEVEGEISTVNNVVDVFIDVLDSRQKVLLLAHSPHPDVAAIKNAIESNVNYEVEVKLASDFDASTEAYSLVILHQLPSRVYPLTDVIEELTEKKRPTLYVLGSQTNFNTTNQLNLGVQLVGFRGQVSEATAFYDRGFTLFNVDEQLQQTIHKFPPLHTPFGTYKTGNSLNPVFTQKVGMVRTELPLFVFNKHNGVKSGVITGEGIWRWRIYDYNQNKSHDLFNGLITKTVQYLAAKEDKSLFRVYCDNAFQENENIVFDGELYNDSYELINDAEVSLTIANSEGTEYPFAFTKTGNAYRLDAGQLPVGEYSYEAKVTREGKELAEKGEFSVSAIQIELANTVADHQMLFNLSSKTNGKMLMPSEIEQLTALLEATEEIVSVSYTKTELSDMLNLKWIFFLILGLLTLEWFARKRSGAY